jgi:hypothetical protein
VNVPVDLLDVVDLITVDDMTAICALARGGGAGEGADLEDLASRVAPPSASRPSSTRSRLGEGRSAGLDVGPRPVRVDAQGHCPHQRRLHASPPGTTTRPHRPSGSRRRDPRQRGFRALTAPIRNLGPWLYWADTAAERRRLLTTTRRALRAWEALSDGEMIAALPSRGHWEHRATETWRSVLELVGR